jgi:hypothetical protein
MTCEVCMDYECTCSLRLPRAKKSITHLVKEAMLGAHSPLGASAADRWINCPGSVGATITLPDVDTEYSLEGTAAHQLAEFCNDTGMSPKDFPAKFIVVEKVDGTLAEIPCDKQMRDGVQAFLDFVNDIPGDDYNEERVHWHEFVPNAFGTMDRARATRKKLTIIDLKYGEGYQVWAADNAQLMLYALGFLEKYGWMYEIDEIEMIVFQPRLDHIDSWTISVGRLLEWARETMKPAAEMAQKENAPFKAGAHCKFCKIRTSCAARAKHVFDGAVGEMDDLDAQVEAPTQRLATLTNDQIAKILARKAQVSAFYSDIEEHAFREVSAGRPVGDWKVVEGRSNRAWSVDKDAVVAAVKKLNLEPKLLWTEPKLVSPAGAEEAYGAALFAPEKTNKKTGVVTPAGALASLVVKPKGSPVLAPGSDKRPPLKVEVDEMEDVSEIDRKSQSESRQ